MDNLYSYIRFSSVAQEEGDSVRRQTEMTQRWAKNNGYVLDESLTMMELGVSAYSGKNLSAESVLGLFLQAVKLGKVPKGSILAIERLDRLTRQDVDTAYDIWRNILKSGIKIVTVANGMIYDESSLKNIGQLFVALVEFSLANQESEKKSERLKEMWSEKRKKLGDRKATTVCPSWLSIGKDLKEFEVIEKNAKIVKDVFDMYDSGVGIADIAKELNRQKRFNFSRYGNDDRTKIWLHTSIKCLLRNEAVIGRYQPHRKGGKGEKRRIPIGESINDYYPSIIDEALFFRCQAKMETSNEGAGRPSKERKTNLFRGMLRCGYCGSPTHIIMGARTLKDGSKKAVNIIRCKKGMYGDCYPFGWDMSEFEAEFFRFCKQVKNQLQQENNDGVLLERIATAKKMLEDGNRKMNRYRDIIEGDEVIPKDIVSRMNQLEDEITVAKAEITSLESKLGSSPVDDITIDVKLDDGETREKAARAVRSVFKQIDLYPIGTQRQATIMNKEVEALKKLDKKILGRCAISLRRKYKVDDNRYFIASSKDGEWTFPRVSVVESTVTDDGKGIASKYPKADISAKEQIVEDLKNGLSAVDVAKKYGISVATAKNMARMHK